MKEKNKKSDSNENNELPQIKPPGKFKIFWATNKRKIYFGLILTIIILAYLFVRNMRDQDKPPEDVNEPVSISTRVDMAGKLPVQLVRGDYVVGIDIPAGRYLATTVEHSFGSVTVYELGTKVPEVSEILGVFAEEIAYVESIALTLVEEQEIKIDGIQLKEVIFSPLQTELRTELTTGVWEVGLDIEPGIYRVSSKDGLGGSITLLDGYDPVGRERLGNDEATNKPSAVMTLHSGQTIRIARIPTVVFDTNSQPKPSQSLRTKFRYIAQNFTHIRQYYPQNFALSNEILPRKFVHVLIENWHEEYRNE